MLSADRTVAVTGLLSLAFKLQSLCDLILTEATVSVCCMYSMFISTLPASSAIRHSWF